MAVAILYPVLAQIVLTLLIMMAMGWQRQKALRSHAVSVDDIALDGSRWPDRARQFSNCFANQFELPVLFYALCLMAHSTRTADWVFVILAWIFVISRVIHAYIHTGSNVVSRRAAVFAIGFLVLVIMTALLAFRLLISPMA